MSVIKALLDWDWTLDIGQTGVKSLDHNDKCQFRGVSVRVAPPSPSAYVLSIEEGPIRHPAFGVQDLFP